MGHGQADSPLVDLVWPLGHVEALNPSAIMAAEPLDLPLIAKNLPIHFSWDTVYITFFNIMN